MGQKKPNLIFTVSLLLIAGFLLTSLASYFVSRASLRRQITESALPLTSDTVYSEVQRDLMRPIFISSLMAHDTFLRDWVLNGERTPEEVTRYLREIQRRYQTETSFFVSEQTRAYYHSSGILKQVTPEEERDRWFFRVREMANDYEINIDPDMANRDTLTVFINYRMFDYEENFIGATGVGLTVNAVKELIDRYQEKYGREIYFVDQSGTPTLHGRSFSTELKNLVDRPGISPALVSDILKTSNGRFSFSAQGSTVHLNSRFIPEFGWFLLVEQNEAQAVSNIRNTLLLNLLICALLGGIVLYLTHLTINSYQKKIATLRGIVPICAYCKKIRDDQGYWNQVEAFVEKHTEAEFTHAYCPSCIEEHYPGMSERINRSRAEEPV